MTQIAKKKPYQKLKKAVRQSVCYCSLCAVNLSLYGSHYLDGYYYLNQKLFITSLSHLFITFSIVSLYHISLSHSHLFITFLYRIDISHLSITSIYHISISHLSIAHLCHISLSHFSIVSIYITSLYQHLSTFCIIYLSIPFT